MECLTGVGALKTVKMLVLSNIFRSTHPQNQLMTRELNPLASEKQRQMDNSKLVTQNSLRIGRTKTRENINITDGTGDKKTVRREKCLSNSVDAIVSRSDTKSKVICSAKGLLETNLDDLFGDGWSAVEPKSLGASEPTLHTSDGSSKEVNVGSVVSGDDSDDDSASDSDYSDEEVREQRMCMGARRFGHLLRRVISRNGEFMMIE